MQERFTLTSEGRYVVSRVAVSAIEALACTRGDATGASEVDGALRLGRWAVTPRKPMTAEQFRQAVDALWGRKWLDHLVELSGCHRSTAYRWASGKQPVPELLARNLDLMLESRLPKF
jgi:hypothetical protein